MLNSRLLMSDALHFTSEQAINPYYFDSKTDTVRAQQEHDAIRTALVEAGVKVTLTPSPSTSQDGVYTANWALVKGNKAVLARLPNVRKTEEQYAKNALEALGKEVIYVPAGLRFSGQGDALPCGDFLFCGKGYRSDEAAQQFAAEQLGFTRIQLQTIPQVDENGTPIINAVSGWEDSFYYDIDLALSILRPPQDGAPALIAYCKEAFTPESQQILENLPSGLFECILIDETEAREAFAANLVSTGDTVVMSSTAPHFTSKLKQHGFTVITPEVTELSKGGGYIRCTSLSI